MWIFGYGSLIWKVNFPFQQKATGFVDGYARRFWQGSTDHRGYPEKPGRVVTLVQNPQEKVWGVAYQVAKDDIPNVLNYLDYREKCGYSMTSAIFHPCDATTCTNTDHPLEVMIYIATPGNDNYLGPASMEDIAEQIMTSVGPSGANDEYLFNLAEAVRDLLPTAQDEHLFELERLVQIKKALVNSKNEDDCHTN